MKDERVFMLHALWFKPNGGRKRYREYLKLATPIAEAVGGRRLRSLSPERSIVGDFDADLLFFIEFPSWDAYKKFFFNPEHHKIAHIREDAITKMLLIKCLRPEY